MTALGYTHPEFNSILLYESYSMYIRHERLLFYSLPLHEHEYHLLPAGVSACQHVIRSLFSAHDSCFTLLPKAHVVPRTSRKYASQGVDCSRSIKFFVSDVKCRTTAHPNPTIVHNPSGNFHQRMAYLCNNTNSCVLVLPSPRRRLRTSISGALSSAVYCMRL